MADTAPESQGLALPKADWPSFTATDSDRRPIDRLKPGTELHRTVLDYLVSRLEDSEKEMSKFYSRWSVQEKKIQAYIDLPKWEEDLAALNDAGEPPKITSIIVPYTFATVSTIVTFLLHTFAGRRPMFQVGSYKEGGSKAVQAMETLLQFQADHSRLVKHLFQFLQDTQVYGLGVMRTLWENTSAMRTVITGANGSMQRSREQRIVYQGNTVIAQDPFMFFPDPRVPMTEVNRLGEFVFWRDFTGRHILLREQADGKLKWVEHTPEALPQAKVSDSARSIRALGTSTPGGQTTLPKAFVQRDQGSVEIIPAELGLGESEAPEKWLFTILNKKVIVQAEPLGMDHGMHPICVSEPYTMGYGFGQLGIADYLGPLQDAVTWLINSHIDNVRRTLNNMFIVDPSRVEMQDFKNPSAARILRLKRSAFGQDVRTVITQFPVADVTGQHVRDAELFMRMGQQLSAVTENLMGVQEGSSRKTASEVRISGESAASRLSAQGRLISAQGLVDLTEQMSLNTQQYLSEEYLLQVVGQEGIAEPINIGPTEVVGDFHYPIHDGTLPIDRIAMFDVWRQVFQAVQADPALRQSYSLSKIFEHVAELGGAKNIESMRLEPRPDAEVEKMVQAGDAVDIPSALGGSSQGGQTLERNPGSRVTDAGSFSA